MLLEITTFVFIVCMVISIWYAGVIAFGRVAGYIK